MRRNGRDAPIPDLPAFAAERGDATVSGRSLGARTGAAHVLIGCCYAGDITV